MNAQQQRFEALLDSHKGIAFKVVRTYARHPEDQQDLAQEIKLQLWSAFAGYDENRRFSTWMYRIALNVAISWSRKAQLRNTVALESIEREAAAPEADPDVQALYHLIDGLDPLHRALLLLLLEGLTYAEIGDILGLSENLAATKVSRLKERLRHQAR